MMKINISTKLIVIISIIFSISFSLSAYLFLYDSTKNTIHQFIDAAISTYSFNYNTIKNEFMKYNLHYPEIDGEFVSRTAESLGSFQEASFNFSIQNENDTLLYTNTDFPFQQYKKKFKDKNQPSYYIEKVDHKYMLILTSVFRIDMQEFRLSNVTDISEPFLFRDRQLKRYYAMCLGIQLITLLILFLLIRKITKPIHILKVASEEIALGNYAKRTNIHSNDEIGNLSRSYDKMAEAVQDYSIKMEKMLRNREMFVGAFSHELKTPLTTIIGYSDMLLHLNMDADDKSQAYLAIYEEGKRLDALSKDLLNLLMIQHEKHDFTSVSTGELAAIIKNKVQQYFENIKLVVDMEEVYLLINKNLFVTLLLNLIKNSVKANPKDDSVYLIGWRDNTNYCVHVLDYGCGMSEEQLAHCKEPFYKVDNSQSNLTGNGLGLVICNEIANYHHFEFMMDSLQNVGTCVSFEMDIQCTDIHKDEVG